MKKELLIVIAALAISGAGNCAILHVPADYPTIQAAVDACCSGDEIKVAPGIYQPVYADSLFDITFTGAGFLEPHKTVIEASDSSVGMWIWHSEKIIVQGFEIRDCWEGCLAFEFSSNIVVRENYLHDCNDSHGNGLGVRQCENVLVYRNIIVDNYEIAFYIDPIPLAYPLSRNLSIINNTIGFTGIGSSGADGVTIAWSDSGLVYTNNINVFNSDYGLNYKFAVQTNLSVRTYNDHFGNLYGPWGDCTPGAGNIYLDPQFVGGTGAEAYFLLPTSPCIDAGDPHYLDPDSTHSDIGALYYDQGPGVGLFIQLDRYNLPGMVPPQGGTYQYRVTTKNTFPVAMMPDVWAKMKFPNGNIINILTTQVYLFSGEKEHLEPVLSIPGNYPPGNYKVMGYIGFYAQGVAMDSSLFHFSKSAGSDLEALDDKVLNKEGQIGSIEESSAAPSVDVTAITVEPNPFNQSTVVSYRLTVKSDVNLTIYDITGQEVAKLVDGFQTAGSHSIIFDAKDLASGVYFARLQAGEFVKTRKMLLIK